MNGADGGHALADVGLASDAAGSGASSGPGASCTTDADCAAAVGTNACVASSSCDPTSHVCMLDVCNVGACAVASCDLITQQCAAATPTNFTISVFPVVSGGVGGLGPTHAIAAAYPFLFVLTTNGVAVYDVANPTGNVPSMVTLHGLPFIPAALLVAGRRVYFVSTVEGGGPAYRQAIAWVDVPGNPFLTSLEASAAFIETTQSVLDDVLMTSNGIDLVYAAPFDPTAAIAPPIADSMLVVPAPLGGLAPDAGIVAASGTDLVVYRYASASRHPVFATVTGVAQNSGLASPEHTILTYGAVDNQATFASGDDGTVLWESAPLHTTDAGTVGNIATARLAWLTPTTDGGLLDPTVFTDLESYPDASATTVVGPALWLDTNTAVALAATGEDTLSTSVQVFDRATGSLVAGKRGVIPAPPHSLGIAASSGFVYVLSADDPNNRSASVYVLAPACSGGDVGAPDDAGPGQGADGGDAALSDGGRGTHAGGFAVLAALAQ